MNRHVSALSEATVAIFLFHGVVPEHRHQVRNYTRKHLAAAEFAAVIDDLVAAGAPVSMNDIVTATCERKALPSHAFAVTFDDGFANNFEVARPLLASRQVPATFYVTSAFIDANACSWTDQIEYAFETCPDIHVRLPLLPLEVAGARTPSAKRQALDDIRRGVKASPALDPYEVAADIWRQLGITAMEPDPDLDRKMTWTQVRDLAADPLFEVGGHGHTHRVLEFLSDDALHAEVDTSLAMLADNLGRPVTHYSYPEGLPHCYSDRVIRLLREHRIACAPSAVPGVNRVGDDLFRLRRITVD